MKNIIVLENLRSCYNVGDIIRTADALGRDVVLVGYTPSPNSQPKVKKNLTRCRGVYKCERIFYNGCSPRIFGITKLHDNSRRTYRYCNRFRYFPTKKLGKNRAVILGNEVTGVELDTLSKVDSVVKIPMIGVKESLNVGQTAAIFMWSLK